MDSKIASRIWWSLVIRGVLAIVFGIVAFIYTGQTLLSLVLVFGVFAVLSGIASLVAAVRAGEVHQRWGWLAVSGLLSIAAGVMTFVWPGITALAFVLLVAAWAIFTGVMEITFALALPETLAHPWLMGFSGLLSVVLGIVLAVWLTPGQRHESQAFAIVMLRAKRPRRANRRSWPRRVGGDKGYSYPSIRAWVRRHHLGSVIPTRKNQQREPSFDRAAYRRRSRIEQVIGWYKECRALGTRYEKLAVNYVALWMVAIIEKLLRKSTKWLKPHLSDRA